VIYSAANPHNPSETSMSASNPTTQLSELRRQLEELLALLNSNARDDTSAANQERGSATKLQEIESTKVAHDARLRISNADELFDDALVLLTEFGTATPAMLQMWLSIDYNRASRILSEFQAQGLVSPRGKARHKAYELRRCSR